MIRFAGRACRLPMAPDVAAFGDLLSAGRCAVTEIPETRWRHAPFHHPVPGTPGRSYSFAAGVVDTLEMFDPKVFGISPREALYMDPQQRLFLQVVWEALEDACLKPSDLAGKDIGVFAGASLMDYGTGLAHDPRAADGYVMSGSSLAVIANRVSHVFDWHGPSMTIDTACSSSLFALKAAQRALDSGEVDIAVVGATNALLLPGQFVGFAAARMLSPSGLCQAFGAGADGYVRGEGAVAFVLVRDTPEAPISPRDHGRLLHVETNTSGQTVNIALPSAEAQERLLERAYAAAGVAPDALAFVEAHGTGTAAGDPAEARALGHVLGQRRTAPLPIGSVKSNIGHLEPAAGSAGLLKALLALETGQLPASLHADERNPDIAFDALNLDVATTPRRFEVSGAVAGVSSFGFGGANAHAVLAGPAAVAGNGARPGEPPRPIHVMSAFCRAALAEVAQDHGARLFDGEGRQNTRLVDEALHYRDLHPERLALLATDADVAAEALDAFAEGKAHPALLSGTTRLNDEAPVFVFSGNGGQHAGMSRAAYAGSTAYRAAYDRVDRAWQARTGWSLVEKMQSDKLADELGQAPVSQPLLFADQVAMAEALRMRGVGPAAVMGHSAGEVAAALVSGALDLSQAVRLIEARSVAQHALAGQGTMAALQLGEDEARDALEEYGDPQIEIAAINSPRSVSIVGPKPALDAITRHARKILRAACVPIRVNYPFHSSAQEPLRPELLAVLGDLSPSAAEVPFISTVGGKSCPGRTLDARYWWANMRRPVLFRQAFADLVAAGHRLFVEIGPDPVLAGYMRDCLREETGEHAVTFARSRKDPGEGDPVDRALARLLVSGGHVPAGALAPRPAGPARELGHYPWQNTAFSATSTDLLVRETGRGDCHPLLGIESAAGAHLWQTEMDSAMQHPFADHRVGGRCLLPGTALAEMALAAARRSLGSETVVLTDFDMTSALSLSPRSISEVRTEVIPAERRVRIASRPRWSDDAWRQHAAGRVAEPCGAPRSAPAIAPDCRRLPSDGAAHQVYDRAREVGLDYGPGFRTLSHFRLPEEDVIEVLLRPDRPGGYDPAECMLDPIGTDGVLHGLIGALQRGRLADLALAFVPTRIGRLDLVRPGCRLRSGRLHLRRRGERSLRVDLSLFDGAGELAACLSGVELRAVRVAQQIDFASHAFRLDAVPVDLSREADRAPAPWPEIIPWPEAAGDRAEDTHVEPALLLDALAQRVTRDALLGVADAEGVVAMPRNGAPARDALVSLAESCGLAERGAGEARILARESLPEAADLVAGISAEYPHLTAETVALARLAEVLPGMLRGTPCDGAEAVFGRAACEALDRGSAFSMARAGRLAQQVAQMIPAACAGRAMPLRVVELCVGAPRVLPRVRDALAAMPEAGVQVELWALDDECPALLPPGLRDGIGRLAPSHLPELGPIDLVLSSGSALCPVISSTRLAALVPHLRDGAALLLAEQEDRPHARLLALPDELARFDTSRSGQLPARLQDLEGVAEAVRAAGIPAPRAEAAADAGGTSCVIARHEAAAHASRTGHAPVEPGGWAEPGRDALAARITEALLTAPGPDIPPLHLVEGRATRSDGTGPLLVVVPPASDDATGDAVLRARILALRDLVHEEDTAHPRPIWLVCPGGAGAPGKRAPRPGQAALWSLMRTIKNEYPALDLHAVDCGALPEAEAGARIAVLAREGTDETELVLEEDGPRALRVRVGAGGDPAPAPVVSLCGDPAGGLEKLRWCRGDEASPGPGQVRVRVEATGLNYRDVMWAMGLLPEEALEGGVAGASLGLECAGLVEELGDGVSHLARGDRVASFGPACLSSHVVTDASRVAALPADMSPDEAATLPVTFFTAYYALVHLGRLRAGETVLIHGAAGGVGLAAIQVAQWRGARIIATAGTGVKRAYLRALGVEHVFSSRCLDFDARIRAATGGVDLVLNGLAGEAMERSLGLLRPFGRFLELGKVDFYANTGVGLRPLKDNVAYHGVDIDRLLVARPDLARDLFSEVMDLVRDGTFAPLPLRVFEGDDAEEAFRLMQRSGHVGKVVIRPPATPRAAMPEVPALYRGDARTVSVIAGGASGLGLELAERLVRGGARRVAVLGRAPEPSEALAAAMARAVDGGAEIRYFPCDIAEEETLGQVLDRVRGWGDISLVVNSAMTLEDRRLVDLDEAVLERVMAAKVAGTRNLDRATRGDRLRNFVVFTSMATLIGNHGQGAYVAANAWAEALIRRRRDEGLPGLAVGWGAITDSGYLTRDAATAQLLHRFGGGVEFGVRQALRALDQVMLPGQEVTDAPVLWISPMSWAGPVSGLRLLRGPTFAALQALGRQAGDAAESEDLRETLVALDPEAATRRLTAFLSREIARILRVPETGLSASRPVSELGIDSLMGVELGLAAQQALGEDIPLMAISDAQSMTEIARRIVGHVQGGAAAEGAGSPLGDLAAQHLATGGASGAGTGGGSSSCADRDDGKMEAAE